MSKVLKWALASGEMALFVCHSAEHHFAEKTFLPESADGEKGEKNSWSWGFGSHSWAHRALAIVGLWHWHLDMVRERKELKACFFFSCLLPHKLFCHCSQFSETAVIEPSNHMNMHDKSAFLLCPWAVFFFFHPETCRVVFDWPWHLKRSLNLKKKKLFMTTGELSLQQSKNGILKGAQLLHI